MSDVGGGEGEETTARNAACCLAGASVYHEHIVLEGFVNRAAELTYSEVSAVSAMSGAPLGGHAATPC